MRFLIALKVILIALVLALCAAPAWNQPARAAAPITAYDLIAGVNALRAARGLSQLTAHPSLMASAQAHTDYQAAIGSLTHTGAGGTLPIDRARAAGYGGGAHIAIAENIAIFSENTTDILSKAIYQAWADDLHMNTMINTGLQHAGAGVTVKNGRVYLTLDTGWIAGQPLVTATRTVSGTPPTPTAVTIIPYVRLLTSTPMADGSVYHVVGYGQVLSSIASAYEVKVADLAAINRVTPDQIYAGQKLFIHGPQTTTPPGSASAIPTTVTIVPKLPSTTPSPSPGASFTARPSPLKTQAATPTTGSTEAAAINIEQLNSNEIGILAVVACGFVALLIVSLRKK